MLEKLSPTTSLHTRRRRCPPPPPTGTQGWITCQPPPPTRVWSGCTPTLPLRSEEVSTATIIFYPKPLPCPNPAASPVSNSAQCPVPYPALIGEKAVQTKLPDSESDGVWHILGELKLNAGKMKQVWKLYKFDQHFECQVNSDKWLI